MMLCARLLAGITGQCCWREGREDAEMEDTLIDCLTDVGHFRDLPGSWGRGFPQLKSRDTYHHLACLSN